MSRLETFLRPRAFVISSRVDFVVDLAARVFHKFLKKKRTFTRAQARGNLSAVFFFLLLLFAERAHAAGDTRFFSHRDGTPSFRETRRNFTTSRARDGNTKREPPSRWLCCARKTQRLLTARLTAYAFLPTAELSWDKDNARARARDSSRSRN